MLLHTLPAGNNCDFGKIAVISCRSNFCRSNLLLSLCMETINVRPSYTHQKLAEKPSFVMPPHLTLRNAHQPQRTEAYLPKKLNLFGKFTTILELSYN